MWLFLGIKNARNLPEIKNIWDKDTGIALEKVSTLQFN